MFCKKPFESFGCLNPGKIYNESLKCWCLSGQLKIRKIDSQVFTFKNIVIKTIFRMLTFLDKFMSLLSIFADNEEEDNFPVRIPI